jgi:cystathionine beta-lyase
VLRARRPLAVLRRPRLTANPVHSGRAPARHVDLTYASHRHLPFATISDATARRTITTTSATKAFNIAAMRCAVAHIGHDAAPLDFFGTPSILSRVATVAAWRDSESWHVDLMSRLDENRLLVGEWAKVVLSDGAEFCQGTEVDTSTFVRLNFATSTDNLLRILDRISALDRD